MVMVVNQMLGGAASSRVVFDEYARYSRYKHRAVEGYDGSVLKERIGESRTCSGRADQKAFNVFLQHPLGFGQLRVYVVIAGCQDHRVTVFLSDHENRPDFSLVLFEEGSKPWPLQTQGQAGYRAPQDSSTWPKSRAPFSAPTILKRPPVGASLTETGPGEWTFEDGWNLLEAPKVDVDGARLSSAEYRAAGWMRATVPGTVLTTMVDDGIYPDPDFGLNNLAIPESLNKQDYWYGMSLLRQPLCKLRQVERLAI